MTTNEKSNLDPFLAVPEKKYKKSNFVPVEFSTEKAILDRIKINKEVYFHKKLNKNKYMLRGNNPDRDRFEIAYHKLKVHIYIYI